MSKRLSEFDRKTATVTQERGADYGPPAADFKRADRLIAVVNECPDPAARQALRMIAVKMARLIHNPRHLDSAIDIAGYARCLVEVTDAGE